MAKREIKAYKQSGDARWYAGEVKSHLIGVGATKRDDFEATDTSNGVCFGLSIWWIIKSAGNLDFWGWMSGPGQQVADIKAMFRAQRGEHDFTRFEEADKKIRADTGMAKQCKVLMNQGTKFKHAGYYYISLRGHFGNGADASGHAIAAHINPDGICRYFDPNVGEYETDTLQETLVELSQLVRGYNIRDLKIYWCCWA
ncbi:hypothetical protein [Dyella agri]|uniref:Peptidase C58 YopT-type domain-containing protein n=1 Tax=Dyella agri TaxID=1926869 RepID=A0ABW8KM41_9GAMM